jgi:integrase
MGYSVKHLEKHSTTGRLSYRRIYPAELRDLIPGGKRELKVSLGGSVFTAPGVSAKFQQASDTYTANVALARKMASGAFDVLSPSLVATLATTYISLELGFEEAGSWGQGFPRSYTAREDLEQDYRDSRVALRERDREGLVALWHEWAVGFALSQGYRIKPTGDSFAQLCTELGTAACEIWLTIDARRDGTNRLDGKSLNTPPLPAKASRPPEPSKAPAATFADIAETILTSTRQPVGISTAQAARTALRFLADAHGPIIPEAMTRRAVTEWLDLLAQRPAVLPKSERLLPLRDLAARYADRPDVPRLAPKTLNQHSGQIATLWRKGQAEGLIDEALSDPFKGRKAAQTFMPEVPQELSPSELAAIFALPLFTRGERPAQGRGEASYWLPLMLLWTGARPEELAQLIVDDVWQDTATQRWMMRITDEGSHPVKGPRSLKTSKKHSGRRTFPVPLPLIALGLIDYVAWLRGAGESALFPRLTVKNARRHLFPSWGAWWGAYLKLHGAYPAGLNRRQSREFRHNWTTAARASGIDREAREYLQGHTAAGASANEGYGSKVSLGLAIDRLAFAGLDLSGVKVWTAPSKDG